LLAKRLLEHLEVGLTPIGFLDKEPLHGGEATGLPVLGASWDLDRIVRDKQIDHVIVTFSTASALAEALRSAWASDLARSTPVRKVD
jgi:hypothetical protein